MHIVKALTASVVTLAVALGTLKTAEAGSRLNEKTIIKKLIFKKKVRRTTSQRPTLQKKKVRRTFKPVVIKRKKTLKNAVKINRQHRVTRREKKIELKVNLTRSERRSLKRRKTLRRILTAKQRPAKFTNKRRTRRAKRRIAFPAPAVEIVDNSASSNKRPGQARPGTARPGNASNSRRTAPTKWASTRPARKNKVKTTVWRRSTTRPASTYVEDSDDPYGSNAVPPVRVATTRLQRDQIKSIVDAEGLPQIDIEIYFDYDSARIRARSMQDVGVLGRALRSQQLAGSQFMIIGHTDAAGGDDYNLRLSEERAHAVRNFLVNVFGLEGERFFPMGYGEEQLKRPDRPRHAQNRRVQIVNIGDAQQ